jgi:integral membrane protein (TIGR00529 family)
MIDILKILLVFIAILVLLRRKMAVGYVLMLASALLMMLYLMKPGRIYGALLSALTSHVTIKLLLSLSFIMMFELIMREKNVLTQIMDSMRGMLRKKKAVIISMPLLIGMLPSVGGAYFSAPMVDEATRDVAMSPEEKAFINYWYRHPWEYILPLYPGIILASVLTRVNERTFIILNFSYAAAMMIIGLFYGLQRARGSFPLGKSFTKRGLVSLIPILILLLLVIGFHIELHYALLSIIIGLLLFYRYGFRDSLRVVRHGISIDVIALILGVMVFKETLDFSGAVGNLSRSFTEMHIPLLPLVFVLPFTTGILTGITVGAVGSTFPLILSMTGGDVHLMSFAFAAAFMGVLLSPVHVCLILTKEYFKADMWAIYKKIIPAASFVLFVAILEYVVVKYI